MRRFLKSLLELIFPRVCAVCGAQLLPQEKVICVCCLSDLPETRYSRLSRNPMADALNARIPGVEPYSYACALFFYSAQSGYGNISKGLKYHSNFRSGSFFSGMLAERLASSPLYEDVDTVIPVPLHWTRLLRRGYNQAAVIAAEVARGLPRAQMRTDLLRRVRRTSTQTRLDNSGRSGNVKGAFRARAAGNTGNIRHILLVDDVCTTGATLAECHSALRAIFPATVRISVATLGYVR
ncbi:MAG: ComF family protein [Bacteroidales bacterium]|nr:ComF family protein [Bacteroidales bacterium]